MAKVNVNNEYVVNGVLNVKRFIDENDEISIVGTFACHYYFEEITQLETYRYLVSGIEVQEEVFASDDFNILYTFKAKSIDNKLGTSDLTNTNIEKIEKDIYGNEGYLLGTILEKGAE